MKNLIRRVLMEQTEGLNPFILTLRNKFNLSDELVQQIEMIFEKTDCKQVSFENLKGPLGLALPDKLVINNNVLNMNMVTSLFIIFHELAHQYQFKKYGKEKMMGIYLDQISVEEGAELMRNMESVADEFAVRKLRELKQMNLLDYKDSEVRRGYGMNPTKQMFMGMITQYKNEIKKRNITDVDGVSTFFYNSVKSNY
jgi:hypothetical protein